MGGEPGISRTYEGLHATAFLFLILPFLPPSLREPFI